MSIEVTSAILVTSVLAFVVATYRSRQQREPGQLPLVPYGAVQFAAIVTAILMVAHLITLLSGRPFVGRTGFPG